MRTIIKRQNFYLILAADSISIVSAHLLAYMLRFEGQIPFQEWIKFRSTIPYLIFLKISAFTLFGLYKGMWRYTGLFDILNVLKANFIASAAITLAIISLYHSQGFSRSIFVLDGILCFGFTGAARVLIRVFLSGNIKNHQLFVLKPFRREINDGIGKRKLLIMGAGDAGEKMLREIMDNPRIQYKVAGFLDDDPKKNHLMIHGVPVLGRIHEAPEIVSRRRVDEILIAIPSASAREMREIIKVCKETNLKFRTIPPIGEIINGGVSFKSIREVSYEDFLVREPVNVDMKNIKGYIEGKVIFVSGAGGSIGSELCRQITLFKPRNLILCDKTENSLFHLEMDFRERFPDTPITPILGDVVHKDYLEKIFSTYKPHVVIHAAAFKHVPIVELNPWEGIFNNVIGTKNIVEVSLQKRVEQFILISTDKAVNPVGVMGATKRIAEMIVNSYSHLNSARFLSVRFGNVIGSEGSVIHLFKKQIENLGPVTITHREITRYFMTIPEASKLILQAGALGRGGEIFILDMGSPVKILDVARDLIHLSGYEPNVDIEIKFIGLRPGEKLYEELITKGEGIIRTSHEKILVLKGNYYDAKWLNKKVEELVSFARGHNAEGIINKLKEMIPEYQPFNAPGKRNSNFENATSAERSPFSTS